MIKSRPRARNRDSGVSIVTASGVAYDMAIFLSRDKSQA